MALMKSLLSIFTLSIALCVHAGASQIKVFMKGMVPVS